MATNAEPYSPKAAIEFTNDQPPSGSTGRYCPRCGQPTVRGRVADGYSNYFSPDRVANPFSFNVSVPVTAYACRHCGLVRMALEDEDREQLNRITTPSVFWREFGRFIGRGLNHLRWRRPRLTSSKPRS